MDWKEFLTPTAKKLAIAAALFILFVPCLQTTVIPPCVPPIPGHQAFACNPIVTQYSILTFALQLSRSGWFFTPEILPIISVLGALVCYFAACAITFWLAKRQKKAGKTRKR